MTLVSATSIAFPLASASIASVNGTFILTGTGGGRKLRGSAASALSPYSRASMASCCRLRR